MLPQMKSIKTLGVAMAVCLGSVAAAAHAAQITGAGSTWVYPLIAKWSVTYQQKTGTQVNYQAIGSGGGIQQIEAKTVAFGASDMPLTPAVLQQHGLIQFPTAIAGEDLVYNLPGIKPGQLILSGPVVAKIYMKEITRWNDPQIARLNPGVKLPDMAITVVHRSDGSGTTFTFANYLSKVYPEWAKKIGANTSISWPTGVGGKGNQGVASYVKEIRGAIGYVEYAYILESHLSWARMYNSAGKLVSPSLAGFQAAASHIDFTKAQDFYVILTDQPGATTWPISGCTWEILSKTTPKATNAEVTKFFTWGFEHGQSEAKSIAFGPLPTSTVDAIKAYWKKNLGI
ncbi:MAG: phosphate ABC transporter substrate-binding protein PstS [Betaproteobacteria bacterium]|nr:phosphate ABC transporter substrate-binding protein PstS [Betaproteobacteria bacterium]